ncbi:MAG: J domain-containing protein [Candidatus Wallbacteria bacterium]|nr:J domain-containing protein [Candidatus Wallbacteria bacterium]
MSVICRKSTIYPWLILLFFSLKFLLVLLWEFLLFSRDMLVLIFWNIEAVACIAGIVVLTTMTFLHRHNEHCLSAAPRFDGRRITLPGVKAGGDGGRMVLLAVNAASAVLAAILWISIYRRSGMYAEMAQAECIAPAQAFGYSMVLYCLTAVASIRLCVPDCLIGSTAWHSAVGERLSVLERVALSGVSRCRDLPEKQRFISEVNRLLEREKLVILSVSATSDGLSYEVQRLIRQWAGPEAEGKRAEQGSGKRKSGNSQAKSASAPNPLSQYYALLGCAYGAKHEVIRRRFKRLVMTCHPDVLTASRCSQQKIAEGAERFRQLKEARDRLLALPERVGE